MRTSYFIIYMQKNEMEWKQNKITVFSFATIHVPCHPASSISAFCGKLKRKRDARKNWMVRNIAMELGIEDRRSARHIVYYRFKHMHLATKGHTFYQIPKKFNTVYPLSRKSMVRSVPVPISILHNHIEIVHGLRFMLDFLSKRKMDKKLNHLTRFNCKMKNPFIRLKIGAASIIIDVPANIKETIWISFYFLLSSPDELVNCFGCSVFLLQMQNDLF